MVVGLTTSCVEVVTSGERRNNSACEQAIIDAEIKTWERTMAVQECMFQRYYVYLFRSSHPPLVTASWERFKNQSFGGKILAQQRAASTASKAQSSEKGISSGQLLRHKIKTCEVQHDTSRELEEDETMLQGYH